MKQHVLIVFFGFLSITMNAQDEDHSILVGHVVSDMTTIDSNSHWIDLPSILESPHKIEIRFIYSSFPIRTYKALTYDQSWKAIVNRRKEESMIWSMNDVTEAFDLDSIFSQLVENNVFALGPESYDVEMARYYPETDEFRYTSIGVGCGQEYRVEFKVGSNYRCYDFISPHHFADFYPYAAALQNLANIVDIFNALK